MKIVKDKGVEGKVCVVTGAAGVLCSSMTEDLLKHGAKVAVLDLRGDVAKQFCAKLAKKGLTQTLAIEANVLDKASLEAPAEQMTKDVKLEDTFFGLMPEGFEFVNKLNLIGTILPCQVFCKEMLKKGGAVLNFCSMAAYQPLTKVAAYGAAKAGIMNFTSFLATHLAPMGIRVNALAPGFFITNQNRFLMLEKDGKTLTARGNKVIAKTPMRKFGQPSDLHGAARFLLSDEASFITGVTLPVDGGFVCYSGV